MPLSAGSLSASHSAMKCLTVGNLAATALTSGRECHVEAKHFVLGVVDDPRQFSDAGAD